MGRVSPLKVHVVARTIEKILIANRGEIARRIMRTCRDLGIATVAVFSDADADMPFVREADEAVRLGPAPSTESYLRIDKILHAARRTDSDAVHPGYGFLSENAAFSNACVQADIIFIGPSADAIQAMGSKREAKVLIDKAGVPVIPGYHGTDQRDHVLAAEAVKIGFPVLLKASAGGGGKGMKLVRQESEIADAIHSARRESENAFGDPTLLVEKYIDDARHIEIQVFGDMYGHLIHLNERECSIQRRHQKIVEESPAPGLCAALRTEISKAAIQCARTIGYHSAGTVEFVVAPNERFYFLEMNTRLQVEHPITECVTGLDLVEEQIRVAQGEPLRLTQDEVPLKGSAIEVRLYAEDPTNDFLPQSGTVVDWQLPAVPWLRVDSGVETGTHIGIDYDPMLAKVIVQGSSRKTSVERMQRALAMISVQGVVTNLDFLRKVLSTDAFVAGNLSTHFIDQHMQFALHRISHDNDTQRAAMLATLADHQHRQAERTTVPFVPSGWRNNCHTPQWVEYTSAEQPYRVEYRALNDGMFQVFQGEETLEIKVLAWEDPVLILEQDGLRSKARVVCDANHVYVYSQGVSVTLTHQPRFEEPSLTALPGGCLAPMPGKVIELRVAVGDKVHQGQVLLIMEAMKMEHTVVAPETGIVEKLTVDVGTQVDANALLVVIVGS